MDSFFGTEILYDCIWIEFSYARQKYQLHLILCIFLRMAQKVVCKIIIPDYTIRENFTIQMHNSLAHNTLGILHSSIEPSTVT